MATTQLNPSALPGKRYSFSAKTEAVAASGPHTGGPFTALSVSALPGMRHSFSAKTEAGAVSGPHTGLFTELSASALPGARHSFLAKTEAAGLTIGNSGVTTWPVRSDAYAKGSGPSRFEKFVEQLHREDEELLELLVEITTSGILDK